jgi:hypothetical protein
MAKSLRSKWVRKQKMIKRERYGKKELERLETMLKKAKDEQQSGQLSSQDFFKFVSPSKEDDEKMEEEARQYDPVTKRDQYGNYPPWMKTKQIKALKRSRMTKRKGSKAHSRTKKR